MTNDERCAACGRLIGHRARRVQFSNTAAGIDAWFCNTRCRDVYLQALRVGGDEDVPVTRGKRSTPRFAPRRCIECNATFVPHAGRQQYCSRHARSFPVSLSARDHGRLQQIARALSCSVRAAASIVIETNWEELRAHGDIPDGETDVGAMPA